MQPKFQHDCNKCEFLGHYYDHDVYICEREEFPRSSVVARYGDDGPAYASMPSCILRDTLVDPEHRINVTRDDKTILYREWLFSNPLPFVKAMVLALAVKALTPNEPCQHYQHYLTPFTNSSEAK